MIDGILPPRRPDGTGRPPQPQPSRQPRQPLPPRQPMPAEPVFRTPESVAAEDIFKEDIDVTDNPQPLATKKKRWLKLSKKQLIILIVALVVVLTGGGVAAYKLTHKPAKVVVPTVATKTEEKPVETPKPTTVASPLTGVQVAPELAALPVTGVMIENSPDARPQAGLKDAGVVYEAIAEGGITRFLALFQESKPDYIGPVRSVRPYYLEWLQGYDAAIAHVGGSPEALNLIKSAGIKDLDQFSNGSTYQRISTRYAPHNVYTSIDKLLALQTKKGYTKSTFVGFARKADKPATPPTARLIDITMSGYLYNPHYEYDPAANVYKRSEGGKPHVDDKSGQQLAPKVVVVLVMPLALKADGLHSDYSTTGNGTAFIFQDGAVTQGTWEKKGSKEPVRLGDANGSPLAINIGQTWISVVSTAGSVSYKP